MLVSSLSIATTAHKASVIVTFNLLNSTVPIVAEVFEKRAKFDPKRYLPCFRELEDRR